MSIYKHDGAAIVLCLGGCLTNLTVDNITLDGDKVNAHGTVAFRDFGSPFEGAWCAATEIVAGELGKWRMRKKQGGPLASGNLSIALEGIIGDILTRTVKERPQFVQLLNPAEQRQAVKPALTTPSDTSFPSNWAGPPITDSPSKPHISGVHHRRNVKRQRRIIAPDFSFISLPVEPNKEGARASRYLGPKVEYQGVCVCDEIADSTARTPFDWQAYTGGQFPARCFECSCGRRWWQNWPNEVFWVRVLDESAWILLTEYNGVQATSMAHTLEGVYLLDTLLLAGNAGSFTVQKP